MKKINLFVAGGVVSLVVAVVYVGSVLGQSIVPTPAYQTPTTVVPQKFFGSGAPNFIVPGNQPGDFYIDNSNNQTYQCQAVWPSPSPACRSVTSGQWTLVGSGGGGGSGISGLPGPSGFSGLSGATGLTNKDYYVSLCNQANCNTGTDVINAPFAAPTTTWTPSVCQFVISPAGTAPSGQNLILEVDKNGVLSNLYTLPTGHSPGDTISVSCAGLTGNAGVTTDVFTSKLTQVGNVNPGRYISFSASESLQGTTGASGVSGISGLSGIAGLSGLSGVQGLSGISGLSGVVGTSGLSGLSGIASTVSGLSGLSGVAGISGLSGIQGVAGPSGLSGLSGTQGTAGLSGISGLSGTNGTPSVSTLTSSTVTFSGGSQYVVNQNATAATAITGTLPTASAGAQYCIDNGYNGSVANTGTLEILTSAAGQYIVYTDGTLSASGGYVISGGAARDGACVYGIDSTHWMFLPHSPSGGTWTKH